MAKMPSACNLFVAGCAVWFARACLCIMMTNFLLLEPTVCVVSLCFMCRLRLPE